MKLDQLQEAKYAGGDPLIDLIKNMMTRGWNADDPFADDHLSTLVQGSITDVIIQISEFLGEPANVQEGDDHYFPGAEWSDVNFNGIKWDVYVSGHRHDGAITIDLRVAEDGPK